MAHTNIPHDWIPEKKQESIISDLGAVSSKTALLLRALQGGPSYRDYAISRRREVIVVEHIISVAGNGLTSSSAPRLPILGAAGQHHMPEAISMAEIF